jgi:hypothetical protein
MTDNIHEAVAKLKELMDYFDPAKLSGPNQEIKLTQGKLADARDAIETLQSERDNIAEWHATLQGVGLDEIATLLNDASIDALASFNHQAAYQEKFQAIDVGDEERLAGQQQIASEHADEMYDDRFREAEESLKSLNGKLRPSVTSLDEMP